MTTTQTTPTIRRLLIERRGTRYQTEVADEIGVSRNSYRQWESGHAVPDDEWVEPLMKYLGMTESEIVTLLYQSRKARRLSLMGLTTGLLVITWKDGEEVVQTAGDWFPRPIEVYASRPKLRVA